MTAQDVMTHPVQSCHPEMNLAAAAALMWNYDCGALPVLEDGRLVGMITDRDICIALGTRDLPAHEVTVREVEATQVTTCTIEDSVHHVLELMRRARVRRLPVVDREGGLAGIVTLSDVAVRGDKRSRGEIVETIQALRSQQRAAA